MAQKKTGKAEKVGEEKDLVVQSTNKTTVPKSKNGSDAQPLARVVCCNISQAYTGQKVCAYCRKPIEPPTQTTPKITDRWFGRVAPLNT